MDHFNINYGIHPLNTTNDIHRAQINMVTSRCSSDGGCYTLLRSSLTIGTQTHFWMLCALLFFQSSVPILIRLSHKQASDSASLTNKVGPHSSPETSYDPALLTLFAELLKWAISLVTLGFTGFAESSSRRITIVHFVVEQFRSALTDLR
jgi:hypothetical protein